MEWILDCFGRDVAFDVESVDELERADVGCSKLFKEYTESDFNSSLTFLD